MAGAAYTHLDGTEPFRQEKMTTEKERNQRLINWEKNKRRWYNTYLFAGVGINFFLYYTKPYGFDPSGSIFWGSLFGLGIPLVTMFGLSYLHQKFLGL